MQIRKIMKRGLVYWFLAAIVSVGLIGCGAKARHIQMKSQSEKTDIFTEVKADETTPKGFADLTVKANIKTHLEGYYIGESKESIHGKPGYPFLINIDGQAALWNAVGVKDDKPKYDKDGKTSRNAEAGEGMKYILEKKLRLAAGTHKMFFGLPEDNYSTEVEISLKDGEASTLEFKPIYKTKKIPARIPTFLKGINKYKVFLNGQRLF